MRRTLERALVDLIGLTSSDLALLNRLVLASPCLYAKADLQCTRLQVTVLAVDALGYPASLICMISARCEYLCLAGKSVANRLSLLDVIHHLRDVSNFSISII